MSTELGNLRRTGPGAPGKAEPSAADRLAEKQARFRQPTGGEERVWRPVKQRPRIVAFLFRLFT